MVICVVTGRDMILWGLRCARTLLDCGVPQPVSRVGKASLPPHGAGYLSRLRVYEADATGDTGEKDVAVSDGVV